MVGNIDIENKVAISTTRIIKWLTVTRRYTAIRDKRGGGGEESKEQREASLCEVRSAFKTGFKVRDEIYAFITARRAKKQTKV